MEEDFKKLKEELDRRERFEEQGYLMDTDKATMISDCSPSLIIYHFKRKEELRKLLNKSSKYGGN